MVESGQVAVQQAPKDAGSSLVAVSGVRSVVPDIPTPQVVPSQTKAIGVIIPPPDIKAIIDKTAQFVAKNGGDFEKRILSNEKQNNKFNFLLDTDPYHAYYKAKVGEMQDGESGKVVVGGVEAQSNGSAVGLMPPPQAVPQVDVQQKFKIPTLLGTKDLEKPKDAKYTVPVPEGLTLYQLDLIKLSAQFVARNGKAFLTGLASREHSNSQFNFLKPTHSLFHFFTMLCDAYSAVLMPPKDLEIELTKDEQDRGRVLERCLKRLQWEKARDREVKAAADEAEKERLAMQMIDWHDFVVVETIDFLDEEDEDLPAPLSKEDVIRMSKVQLQQQELQNLEKPADGEKAEKDDQDMDVEMDEEEQQLVDQGQQQQLQNNKDEEQSSQEQITVTPPLEFTQPIQQPARPTQVIEVQDAEGPVKVVKNYVRQPKNASKIRDVSRQAISPITGELVNLEDMQEHVRISLIDPKYKEQKEALYNKIKENTKANDEEIGSNLLKLADTRPDIFGSTQEEVASAVQSTIKERMGADSQPGGDLPAPPAQSAPPPVIHHYNHPPPQFSGTIPPPIGIRPNIAAPPMHVVQHSNPGMRPPPPMMMPPMHAGMMAPPPIGFAPGPFMPYQPHLPQMPPPMEEPDSKRQKMDQFVLQPEDEFVRKFTGTIMVSIQCPNIDGNDQLNGQLVKLEVPSIRERISTVKGRLVNVVNLAVNKQHLLRDGVGFLKDDFSLAHYNVGPDVMLQLRVKERGGRKK